MMAPEFRIPIAAYAILLLIVLSFCCEGCTTCMAADNGVSSLVWKRWAVIASPEIEETGLSDLVTLQLAENSELDLVERQQLDGVLTEQERSVLFGNSGSSERLKLGQLLSADAIVFLELTRLPNGKENLLHLTIADTQHGARIASRLLAFDSAKIQELALECRREVTKARRRFPRGVEELVAVVPFVSESLQRDFDHLQRGCAVLLAATLSEVSGVGVLAIDEARDIARELTISGTDLSSRRVPLIVSGEFEADLGTALPRFRFEVSFTNSQQQHHEWAGLSEAEMASYITTKLPPMILSRLERATGSSLSTDAQFELLEDRAEHLGRLGAFDEAIAVHEAALLIKPASVTGRIAAFHHGMLRLTEDRIRSYNQWECETKPSADRSSDCNLAPGERIADRFSERILMFRSAVRHFEYLVTNRLINPREAGGLVLPMVRNGDLWCHFEGKHWPEARTIQEPIYRRLFSQFRKLDPAIRNGTVHPRLRAIAFARFHTDARKPQAAWMQEMYWVEVVADCFAWQIPRIRCSRHGFTEIDKDYNWTAPNIESLLTEWVTPGLSQPGMYRVLLHGHNVPGLTSDERRKFWHGLMQHSPTISFVARVGLLQMDVQEADTESKLNAVLDQTRKLYADLNAFSRNSGDGEIIQSTQSCAIWLPHMIDQIEQRLKPFRTTVSKQHAVLANHIPAEHDPRKRRLQFKPQGIDAWHVQFLTCGESYDVMCHTHRVVTIGPNLAMKEIFAVSRDKERITSVVCDDRFIWIAASETGVYVMTPDGKNIARFKPVRTTSEDQVTAGRLGSFQTNLALLPPYTSFPQTTTVPESSKRSALTLRSVGGRLLRLHSVGSGRCMAVAEYGKSRRIWIAELEVQESGQQWNAVCDVIHVANRENSSSALSNVDDDIRMRFPPVWMTDLKLTDSHYFLVGRPESFSSFRINGRRPLAIDLSTRKVSLHPLQIADRRHRFPFTYRGAVVAAGVKGIDVYHPEEHEDGQRWNRTEIPDRTLITAGRLRNFFCQHITDGDSVVIPGPRWVRVSVDDAKVEELTDGILPLRFQFERYGRSNHFGMVAWNQGDQLYQVLLDRPVNSGSNLAMQYPFIPKVSLGRHHTAVTRIRQAGGFVDTRYCKIGLGYPYKFAWKTAVFLPKAWRGTDEDFAAILDLHHVDDVRIVQANVSERALRSLNELASLELLALVETSANDDLVALLMPHRQLHHLHLEGHAGQMDLTDDALFHLKGSARLSTLSIYGVGFTEAGIAALQKIPQLRLLNVVDTRMPEPALRKARSEHFKGRSLSIRTRREALSVIRNY